MNDYGRPFENGFNNYSGVSGYATAGRFALYVRGEFQGAPSATGYSAALAQTLWPTIDNTGYYRRRRPSPATRRYPTRPRFPRGPSPLRTQGRFLEAYLSYQYLNHVVSFGKQDQWLGPAQGASMAFSNNAQNFYAFEINRIEPLNVPLLSRLTGPFRYEFLIGALRGHTLMPNPALPEIPRPAECHQSRQPMGARGKGQLQALKDLEFGFERTAIFGGEGHSPVTLHTFLKSFFSLTAHQSLDKNGRDDPGARFGAFDFTWRLPYLQQVAHPLQRLGGARRCFSDRCAAPRRRASGSLSLACARHSQARSCASKAASTDPPTEQARAACSCTMRGSKSRDTPTRANSSAIGSAAKTRAARPGSPIT